MGSVLQIRERREGNRNDILYKNNKKIMIYKEEKGEYENRRR